MLINRYMSNTPKLNTTLPQPTLAQRLAAMSDARLQIVIATLTAQGLNSKADKDLHTALCAEVLKRKKG